MPKSYIVYCEQGHWKTLISGDPDYASEAAIHVAKLIRDGEQVERIDHADIVSGKVVRCKCERKDQHGNQLGLY